jgi:eukaryotic-like serine/threonine-protein kinase
MTGPDSPRVLRRGDRLADWIVDALLGEGAMGAVYRVHSAMSERVEAALKVMKPSGEANDRALFVREAEALCALRHPAIVHVMGFSEDTPGGLLCLVMELAIGETLRQRLDCGAMPLLEALHTFVPLASALDHAHDQGIFHRDLKPANVVLCADGPRLVDFGIAALAREPALEGEVQMGTLAYLPPEVFHGGRGGPAAMDVYAFGLLLHEALTGSRGFAARPGLAAEEAAQDIVERKRWQGPFDPGERFPHRLREVVRSATDPDPGRRPPMRDVRASLESLQERRAAFAVAREAHDGSFLPAGAPADATVYVPDPPASSEGT